MPKDKIENPTKNLTVKEWNSEDQPREKLMLHGAQSLSNSELLAILLRTGLKGENVLALSQRILSTVNNDLARLGSLSVEQILRDFKGIGPAKAVTLAAALELGRRRKEEASKAKKCLNSSTALYEEFAQHISYLDHEEMWIIFMNNRLAPLEAPRRLTTGGIAPPSSTSSRRCVWPLSAQHRPSPSHTTTRRAISIQAKTTSTSQSAPNAPANFSKSNSSTTSSSAKATTTASSTTTSCNQDFIKSKSATLHRNVADFVVCASVYISRRKR